MDINEEKKRDYDERLYRQARLACEGLDRGGTYETVFQTKPKKDRDSGGYPVVIPVLFPGSIWAPPIGLRLCGGCVQEDGQIVCYDYFCIEGPYTISIILSHVIPAYVFVCYSTWAWNKTRGIEPKRKRLAVGTIYVLSWPLVLMFLPFVLLLIVSVIRPDYFPSCICQFPLPIWATI